MFFEENWQEDPRVSPVEGAGEREAEREHSENGELRKTGLELPPPEAPEMAGVLIENGKLRRVVRSRQKEQAARLQDTRDVVQGAPPGFDMLHDLRTHDQVVDIHAHGLLARTLKITVVFPSTETGSFRRSIALKIRRPRSTGERDPAFFS